MTYVQFIVQFLVAVLQLSFSSGFPLVSQTNFTILSNMTSSSGLNPINQTYPTTTINKTSSFSSPLLPYYHANPVTIFASPCQENAGTSTGNGDDPRIVLSKMNGALAAIPMQHCIGNNELTLSTLLQATRISLQDCNMEGKAVAHKAAMTLHLFSEYLRRFHVENYETFYFTTASILQQLSCSLLSGDYGLAEDELGDFAKQQVAELAKEREPSDQEVTWFINNHCTFAAAAKRTLQVLTTFYNEKCTHLFD